MAAMAIPENDVPTRRQKDCVTPTAHAKYSVHTCALCKRVHTHLNFFSVELRNYLSSPVNQYSIGCSACQTNFTFQIARKK